MEADAEKVEYAWKCLASTGKSTVILGTEWEVCITRCIKASEKMQAWEGDAREGICTWVYAHKEEIKRRLNL
jgi:hypothetical protein